MRLGKHERVKLWDVQRTYNGDMLTLKYMKNSLSQPNIKGYTKSAIGRELSYVHKNDKIVSNKTIQSPFNQLIHKFRLTYVREKSKQKNKSLK